MRKHWPFFIAMNKDFWVFKDRKESDRYRWVGVFSNSFQDNDSPPDIIQSTAHEDATRKLEIGEYEMPLLFLWHEPAWKIGVADHVFLDKVAPGIVFVIATGLIDEDKEFVAEPLSKVRSTMSQGVRFFDYSLHVNREGQTREVREYRTYEISVLPEGIASPANPYTYFNMEAKMIDPEKRERMKDILSEDMLSALESNNQAIASKAAEAGTQYKDGSTALPTMEEIVSGQPSKDRTEDIPVPEATVEQTAEEQLEDTPAEGTVEIDVEDVAVELSADDLSKAIAAHVDNRMAQFAEAIVALADSQVETQRALKSLLSRTEAAEKDLGAVREMVVTPPAATPAFNHAIFHMNKSEGDDSPAEAQGPVETEDKRGMSLIQSIFGGIENGS